MKENVDKANRQIKKKEKNIGYFTRIPESVKFGWIQFPNEGGLLKPTTLFTRFAPSSRIRPKLAVGFFNAFCSSLR